MEKEAHGIRKRKKKRSFMQRVKRLTTNKSFFSETKFESVEYEYFMRVFKMTRIFEGTEEDKVTFANNALAQTENREVDCSSNQLISRVMESLLPLASNTVLRRFMDAFSANLRPICNHGFASHVLRTLMIIATRHSLQECNTEEESSLMDFCQKWVLKVSKFLLNNIDEYISETYANPVLRTAMYCLAGLPHLDTRTSHSEKKKSSFEQNSLLKDISIPQSSNKPSEEYTKLLEAFYTRISKWPHFKDLVSNSLYSGFLHCLLTALHFVNRKNYKILSKMVLSECFSYIPNQNESAMLSPSALPVLEIIIENSGPKRLKMIHKNLLAGRVAEMSSVKTATFTLIKFVNKCDSAELVAEIVTEVLPELGTILSCGYGNLLVGLCQACERLKSAQSEFFQGLVKAFKCENSLEQLVPALLALTPLPHSTPAPPCIMYGSKLVQSLLKFQKPIKVVNSVLSYTPGELTTLLCSQYGCHITDAFCKSEFVGEKNRQKLIQHLLGHFPEIANSKHGSRSFDDIWIVADDKNRLQIVKDISSCASKVMCSNIGKFVATKIHLKDFRTLGADKWKEKLKRTEAKKKMFEPIIMGKIKEKDECEPIVKKKKHKKVKHSEIESSDPEIG